MKPTIDGENYKEYIRKAFSCGEVHCNSCPYYGNCDYEKESMKQFRIVSDKKFFRSFIKA